MCNRGFPVYESAKTKLKLSCGKHEFYMTWDKFKRGQRCPKCSKRYRYSHNEICEEVKKLNKGFTVSENSNKYKNAHTLLEIKCKENHIFEMSWNTLKNNHGCRYCNGGVAKTNKEISIDINEIDENYSLCEDSPVYINNTTKIKLYHSVCKTEFYTTRASFLAGNRACKCNSSKGESKIEEFLLSNNIEYKRQLIFDDLRSEKNYPLRYDFGIYSGGILKVLIEYDGEQHFKVVNFGNRKNSEDAQERFQRTKKNDSLKNAYAEKINIPLIRINYKEYKKIEEILKSLRFSLDLR